MVPSPVMGLPSFLLSPPSPSSSLVALDEESRKEAIRRTIGVLRSLEQVRRELDLPPDSIGQILAVYAMSTREIAAEKEVAEEASDLRRLPMSLVSLNEEGKPVGIRADNGLVAVVGRPDRGRYRVEKIEVLGNPSHWTVCDIRVGNNSQLAGRLPCSGEAFRRGGIMGSVQLETCQVAMDIVLFVKYVGPMDEGEVFVAQLVGTVM